MYKGFFDDVAYIFKMMGNACECDSEEKDDEEEFEGLSCDQPPCCRDNDSESEDDEDEDEGAACDQPPCMKEKEEEDEDASEGGSGLLGDGPIRDILKCMFDASDIDYDYED
jgi:hypothetical protein